MMQEDVGPPVGVRVERDAFRWLSTRLKVFEASNVMRKSRFRRALLQSTCEENSDLIGHAAGPPQRPQVADACHCALNRPNTPHR